MSSHLRVTRLVTGVVVLIAAGPAAALQFEFLDNPLKVDNLITIGASWRMQDVDPGLVGKSTLWAMDHPGGQGLCFTRAQPDLAQQPGEYNVGTIPGGCATSNAAANQAFVAAPGSFSPNGDNGDLNFKKGDIVHAVAKLTTDLSWSYKDYNIFVRGVALFDANYNKFSETHYDTTMQPARTDLPDSVKHLVGVDYKLLDYHVSHVFAPYGHDVSVKVGNQVLNWGESSLLALNSLNTINPPDSRRLNLPGLDLKEAFQPIGMVTVGTELLSGISAEAFYTYDWKSVIVDPVGTYFSQSDTLGTGGELAMLSFAKQPEDPGFATSDSRYPAGKRGLYRPIDTCNLNPSPPQPPQPCVDSLGNLGSTASRTVYRDHNEEKAREPNGGDYGLALKTFWPSLNNGTDIAFYYANYDSRLPVVSTYAAQPSCIRDNGSAAASTIASDCGLAGPGNANSGGTRGDEPIPVDTMRAFVEYPKDIKLYGVSFNTTAGDYALSGEYAFRTNLPIQVHTTDLVYTALMPAFPAQDVALGAVTIPGRESAFPSYLAAYRGYACTNSTDCIQPGQYVPGFERFKVGQANLTVLKLIGGDNPIAASQMTLLLEMGMNKVFDMPSLSVLQLQGSGADTHASNGADGTIGPVPDPPMVPNNSRTATLRQNPTAQLDTNAWGTSESYGLRFINLNRWEDALFGINLETLSIVRWDIKGTTPGIGTNFIDGRKQFNFGIRGDYLSQYSGEVRYTWFTGGGDRDQLRDRDFIMVNFGYQF